MCHSTEHRAQSLFSMAASQTGGYIPLSHCMLPPLERHPNITSSFAPFLPPGVIRSSAEHVYV